MLITGQRGFTLLELVLAMFMTLLVTSALYNLLVTTQRVTRLQRERTSLQSSVRAGALIIPEELGELSTVEGGTAAQNDIVAFEPASLTYRAMRGVGFVCQMPGPTTIRIARSTFSGHRNPEPGRDEVMVFIPGSRDGGIKNSWVPAQIVSVATTAPCPGNLGAGITITVSGAVSPQTPEPGTPVRVTEMMQLRLYQSDGASWLGARSVSAGEEIQPLIGPLTTAQGFQLEYLDGTGAPTADGTRIKSIRASVRGTSAGSGRSGVALEEELVTGVTLRNSSRP